MNILVINCGSSSIKTSLIDTASNKLLMRMQASGLNDTHPEIEFDDESPQALEGSTYDMMLDHALELLKSRLDGQVIEGVGHRVVHGGELFTSPTPIDEKVIEGLESIAHLAPLHNPVNIKGIYLMQRHWPKVPHVAVFDTAFHATLPRRARMYAISKDITDEYGIRRYGFHGTSHKYVARKAAEYLGFDLRELRIITCHLGSGASICAVEYGRSVETSMGMTPLEGLVMGTRSGDMDPGILVYLMRQQNMNVDQLDLFLNKKSGLFGLTDSTDMREIEGRAARGDEEARIAIQLFAHRLRKYIGAYAAVMGGVDAIVFTGGIGENSEVIRERVCQRMEFLGAILDEDANRDADTDEKKQIADISTPNSRCKFLVVPTDEQLSIAKSTSNIVREQHKVKNEELHIPIAVSARHVHLTQEMVDILFGKGHQLQVHRWLSQPGQFAAKEQVSLVGPRRTIERVRVLGPTRSKNQVEISRTDEFFLGIDAPVRASGHIDNTPGIKLVGPAGSVTLKEGVICAWRHIHMTPEDAEVFGVEDKDIVEVKVSSEDRSLTFGNVLIRVSPKYKLEMHIDTDEGNAAELSQGAEGVLLSTGEHVKMVKRKTR